MHLQRWPNGIVITHLARHYGVSETFGEEKLEYDHLSTADDKNE